MGRNSQNVYHRGHSNISRTAAEKSAEDSADECDEKNHPYGNRFHAGDRQRNHRPDLEALNPLRYMAEFGMVVLSRLFLGTRGSQRLAALPDHESGNADVNYDRNDANHGI